MYKRLMLTLFLVTCTISSYASSPLSADEINRLKIIRQSLLDEREDKIAEIIANEQKIEMLLAWANGRKPDLINDKALPSAGAAIGGTSLSYFASKYVLPQLIANLPPSVQTVIKLSPAAIGLLVAIYNGHDYKEYSHLIEEIEKALSAILEKNKEQLLKAAAAAEDGQISAPPPEPENPQVTLYNKLIQERTKLTEKIEQMSLAINQINYDLRIYE